MLLSAPCSIGEIYDKITILEIKIDKVSDERKLVNISNELKLLRDTISSIEPHSVGQVETYIQELKATNLRLWDIEDEIRELERSSQFDDQFIQLARSVYITNDERSRLKKQINILLGSDIVEEKSYAYL